jgi:methanesulfonate monooxygenase small subunit
VFPPIGARTLVEELIYGTALLLDAGDFGAFLDRCEPDFRYLVGAYSPEIRRQMVWLDHDKDALQNLFVTLPRHHSDHAPLSRHVTVYAVDIGPGGREASAVSALQVFRTALDGGATELFAVGKIHDTARLVSGRARLVRRRIELQTRMLGIGSHIPF